MKETKTSKLINYYAEALFDVADKNKESQSVFEQTTQFSAELAKDPKNIQRLSNPLWSSESKKQVLTDFAVKKGFSSSLIKTIQLIAENGRVNLLLPIMQKFSDVYYRKNNILQIFVQSAIKLTPKQETSLEKALEKHFNNKVVVNYKINPEILGGLVIECDSKMIDDSIRGKLDRIKTLMKGTK